MGGLARESSALILEFASRASNALRRLADYESHAVGSRTVIRSRRGFADVRELEFLTAAPI
jgi:hypothetical protein